MPELLWKAYIDFETEEGEREKARALYERLIELSGHVKVWISYATFEAEPIPIPRAMREEAEDEDEEAGVSPRAQPSASKKATDIASKGRNAAESTFLPSLAVGFTRGDSDSDWSDGEANVADGVRKNRRGQRARRA